MRILVIATGVIIRQGSKSGERSANRTSAGTAMGLEGISRLPSTGAVKRPT